MKNRISGIIPYIRYNPKSYLLIVCEGVDEDDALDMFADSLDEKTEVNKKKLFLSNLIHFY